ncbi:MAG: FAD-binding protein [Eggerthellaceae bacterium]
MRSASQAAGTPALVASYEAYRDAAAAGADEAFGKPAEAFASYQESGPYYLVSYVPSYVATMGGVKTDADCRVVDESEAPIEGLYAIGEIAHRFMYNRSFVRHCSNSAIKHGPHSARRWRPNKPDAPCKTSRNRSDATPATNEALGPRPLLQAA